jgi:methylglyoxal synthase
MVYESLLLSKKYIIDYQEVDENNRKIPDNYDFYAFNYHHLTMGWLDTRSVRSLSGLRLTFVLEVLPNNPFILCPAEDFDVYCALDPTMNVSDKRVYAFPRPLEIQKKITPYHEPPIPIIGSFGFATQGKGFDRVVEAVNKEFEKAVVKINIPSGSYADDNCKYSEYLGDLCRNTAKEGVDVIITHDYMTKDELIEWCSQNTLNCFLYNRNMPGLSATTDQAISSGRPLAVSDNETFRHITQYIKPYPYRSLKESIAVSSAEVLQIQKDWEPVNFAKRFEQVLADFDLFSASKNRQAAEKMIELKCKQPPKSPLGMMRKIVNKTEQKLSRLLELLK